VDGPGEQLLAGAAFPLQKNRTGAVGHIGQDVEHLMHPVVLRDDVFEGVPFRDRLPELLLDADVPEGLHGSDDPALFILEQGRGNADWKATSRGIHDMDRPVDDGFPRLNGFAEDTAFFADIRLQHVLAALADRLFTADAGDFLCRPIERGDAPVVVDGKNAVGNRVEDDVLFQAVAYNIFIISLEIQTSSGRRACPFMKLFIDIHYRISRATGK